MTAESRPILKPPYPAYIDMGDCPDCHLSWRMSRSEYRHWVEMKLPKGMSMPKRCPDCRADRRREQKAFGEKVRIQRKHLSDSIVRLAEDVKDGFYDENRYELAMTLLDISEQVEKIQFPDSQKGKSHENRRPVQFHQRKVQDSSKKDSGAEKALDPGPDTPAI